MGDIVQTEVIKPLTETEFPSPTEAAEANRVKTQARPMTESEKQVMLNETGRKLPKTRQPRNFRNALLQTVGGILAFLSIPHSPAPPVEAISNTPAPISDRNDRFDMTETNQENHFKFDPKTFQETQRRQANSDAGLKPKNLTQKEIETLQNDPLVRPFYTPAVSEEGEEALPQLDPSKNKST
jgi:hypothetical protein